MNEFRFVIPGESIAKGRPRMGVVNGHAMAYTPKKTRHYEDIVRERAVQVWGTQQPLLCGLTLRATFFRAIPASWPKKKQRDALIGYIRPIGRPDMDNLTKSITDALNGVVYHDDAQIVDQQTQKFYAIEPRVEVVLSW